MYDIKAEPEVATRGAVSTWQGYSHVRSQRTANWLRRMVPHVFGWFTMTSVWFILFTQLEHARRDISEVSDRNIPEWVFAAIIGTSIIFMSFALVRHACSNQHSAHRHAPTLTHSRRLVVAGPNHLPTCALSHQTTSA